MPRRMMRRMGMKGTREPLLWLRQSGAAIIVTSVNVNPSVSLYQGTLLETGVDAGRTVRRLLVSLSVTIVTALAKTVLRYAIGIIKRKIGEATAPAFFTTAAGQQGDLVWHKSGVIATDGATGFGVPEYEIMADVKAMRKMTVNDELRLEASASLYSGAVLAATDQLIIVPVWSALVQRTRR